MLSLGTWNQTKQKSGENWTPCAIFSFLNRQKPTVVQRWKTVLQTNLKGQKLFGSLLKDGYNKRVPPLNQGDPVCFYECVEAGWYWRGWLLHWNSVWDHNAVEREQGNIPQPEKEDLTECSHAKWLWKAMATQSNLWEHRSERKHKTWWVWKRGVGDQRGCQEGGKFNIEWARFSWRDWDLHWIWKQFAHESDVYSYFSMFLQVVHLSLWQPGRLNIWDFYAKSVAYSHAQTPF